MAIDHLGQYENITIDLEKMNSLRDMEHGIVSSAKTKDGYECCWCRRILQQPAGLLRHRDYCPWNPAIRRTTDEKHTNMDTKSGLPMIDDIKRMDPTRVSLQCGWCNRFFSNERGVVRHKAYCSWSPQRLKILKEERKRKREEKAVYKRSREGTRVARQFDNTKKIKVLRPKSEIDADGLIKTEPIDVCSLPSSPNSSIGSPVSPSTPNYPLQHHKQIKHEFFGPIAATRVNPEILKRPAVFSCQTKVRLPRVTPKVVADRISVIASCDPLCSCGCKKIISSFQNAQSETSRMLHRKSSLADSPLSFEEDDDEDEIINVDT